MRTTDGFYAAESYFNPTDSIAAAILCQRLSLKAVPVLETLGSTGPLPDAILAAEVKPVVLLKMHLVCKHINAQMDMDGL